MRKSNKIEFKKFPLHPDSGEIVFDVWLVIENGKCEVQDKLDSITNESERNQIKSLVRSLATVKNFNSKNIRQNLKAHKYREIKTRKGHRVFYFRKCGDNYIFFAYRFKDQDSLGKKEYDKLEEEGQIYGEAFEIFIRKDQ